MHDILKWSSKFKFSDMESSNSFDSAVGDIKILEVNQDGKYVRLVNDGKQVIYNFMIWSIYNCLIFVNHLNDSHEYAVMWWL